MEYLIYDCETIKMIPPKKGKMDPKYDYCKGWDDHAGMGISCIGWAHSNGSEGVIVPDCPSMREAIIDLLWDCEGRSLVGFNSKTFDDKLLAANGMCKENVSRKERYIETDYDLLELIRIAAYGSPSWKDCPRGRSYALGKIGEANGFPKTGSGELAPKLWQDGKRQDVIEYCLNDVRVTRELLELGLKGELVDPNTGKTLKIQLG